MNFSDFLNLKPELLYKLNAGYTKWATDPNMVSNFYIPIENKIKYERNGEEYIQSKKIDDHIKIANELLKNGHAYKCYCSNEEIEEQKKRSRQKKIPYIYDRKWREKKEADVPKNIKPVIRFKSKIEGSSILKDLVQGDVEIENNTIEDFIILRNDGTPTYNLSAAVDDHQMNMTHIIRGDDQQNKYI